MTAGGGKWSTRALQQRMLRARWRNVGVRAKRSLPTSGIPSQRGASLRCGALVLPSRRRWLSVLRQMKSAGLLGSTLKSGRLWPGLLLPDAVMQSYRPLVWTEEYFIEGFLPSAEVEAV